MPLPLLAAGALSSVGTFFGKLFKSPWFYAGLLILAIGGGTYFTLNHWKNEAVSTAVKGADQAATVKTLQTESQINQGTAKVDQQMDQLKARTQKDYGNVRATVQAAPLEQRSNQAAPLLIDTLNQLDRVRAARDATAVPDADVPVG